MFWDRKKITAPPKARSWYGFKLYPETRCCVIGVRRVNLLSFLTFLCFLSFGPYDDSRHAIATPNPLRLTSNTAMGRIKGFEARDYCSGCNFIWYLYFRLPLTTSTSKPIAERLKIRTQTHPGAIVIEGESALQLEITLGARNAQSENGAWLLRMLV